MQRKLIATLATAVLGTLVQVAPAHAQLLGGGLVGNAGGSITRGGIGGQLDGRVTGESRLPRADTGRVTGAAEKATTRAGEVKDSATERATDAKDRAAPRASDVAARPVQADGSANASASRSGARVDADASARR